MKRMWSRNELKKIIKTLVESSEWSFEEDVTFNGLVNFKDDVAIDGDLSIDGAFSVTGNASVFENIVDKDGHERFIEGDVELYNPIEGMTITFGKWSLSGSHFMVVLAGSIVSGTSLSWTGSYAKCVDVPQWVLDKIYPLIDNYIAKNVVSAFNVDLSAQTIDVWLRKTTDLFLSMGSITTTKDRAFRISFDILIDND